MQNLSDINDAATQEIPVITTDTIRYTSMKDAVATVLAAYQNSIDPDLAPWPFDSTVIATIIGAPTSRWNWKTWLLRTRITGAIQRFIPILRVEITEAHIRVLADKSSRLAPPSFADPVRRRD